MEPTEKPAGAVPAPAGGDLVQTVYSPHQLRQGRRWIARLYAVLEATPEPCPGRLIGAGRGE